MKKILAILLVVVMIFSLAACGSNTTTSSTTSSKSTAPLKVGFSLPSMNFPFYVRMYNQIMEEAKTRGWEVSFVDGNLDAGTQLNGCQDLLNKDVDVMIIATWFIDALKDIFSKCEAKGIPVFLMDNMVIPKGDESSITFTTGTDNYNAGKVGGTWYAGILKSTGITKISMVKISSQSEQQVKRCTGFSDALTANGITVSVLNTYNGGEREKAMTVAEDALTAYSALDLIYGGSAQDSLGAYDATTGSKRTEVKVFGFDGEDEELKLIDAKTNYVATITQDPKGQAVLAAKHVDMWLKGEKFNQIEETPAGVYCASGQLAAAEILK